MNKVKLLIIVSSGLLIANLVLLGLFVMRPPGGPEPRNFNDPRKIIIEKLSLDELQQQQYDLLIKSHRSEIRALNETLNDSRRELMNTLSEQSASSKLDSLEMEIGKSQAKIEALRYNHFVNIRKICRPDQAAAFDELVHELPRLLRGPE
jgi:hypothetical protein